MNCAQVKRDGITEKYLLGKLGEEDRQAFEEHYFSCDACYGALDADVALTTELSQGRWRVEHRPSFLRPWPQWAFAAAAAVVVAALGTLLWLRAPTPDVQPSAVLVELSEVQPLPYEPKRLRGTETEAGHQLREAMAPYQARDFSTAIPLLEAVTQSQPTLAEAHLYLGACFLLTNRPEQAVRSLARALELGEGRHAEWALFYRAKAYLRLGDIPAARADLEEVADWNAELAEEARRILDRL